MVKIRMMAKTRMAIAGAPKASIVRTPLARRAVAGWSPNSSSYRADCAATQAGWKARRPRRKVAHPAVEENTLGDDGAQSQGRTAVLAAGPADRDDADRARPDRRDRGAALPDDRPIFLASPYLKIFIVFVFFIGVAACFWQVLTLISSVNWIEGFALDRPGHEFTQAPRLLAPLAAMLAERRARRSLTSSSTRSILEIGGDAHRGAARPHPLHHQPADLPRPSRHLLRPRHRRPGRRRHHPLARPEGGAERDGRPSTA